MEKVNKQSKEKKRQINRHLLQNLHKKQENVKINQTALLKL